MKVKHIKSVYLHPLYHDASDVTVWCRDDELLLLDGVTANSVLAAPLLRQCLRRHTKRAHMGLTELPQVCHEAKNSH